MMKKLVLIWLILALPSCAFGRIDDAIDEIEETLDNLHTADCIRACTDTGEACLDLANGICVDLCEVDENACVIDEDACVDALAMSCQYLVGLAYTNCMNQVKDDCNFDCGGQASNCNQDCADQAQECLTINADCVADCVEELENSLKGIKI